MTVETPMPEQLLHQPFRAVSKQPDEPIRIPTVPPFTCNLLKVCEKLSVQGAIDFGLPSHWLKPGMRFFSQSLSVGIAIV